MARLLIHVEGETEESFVNEVLADHLYQCGYESVSARLVGNARLRDRRGGIRGWSTVKKDILNHLKEDPGCLATTMVDYYALPTTGDKAWPGRAEAGHLPFEDKAACVESALLADIDRELGDRCYPQRFVPFVIIHEFEGLLFSDCEAFGRGIGQPNLVPSFQDVRKQFSTPEEINDFVSWLRVEGIARRSKLTPEAAWHLSEEIKSSWWQANKDRFTPQGG